MLISPPFLPSPTDDDEAFVASAMPDGVDVAPGSGGAPLGSYPLTTALTWHNGLHIRAPHDGSNLPLPVCAISDGTVIFRRDPKPENVAVDDPQNYNPYGIEPTWTDNGIVILKHQTEIGATASSATTVTYYSVYMHLSHIETSVVESKTIRRKTSLGMAGSILGRKNHLHFEICLDEENLQNLMGKSRPIIWMDPACVPNSDGRIDSVFGNIYFYVPPGTPVSEKKPVNHLHSSNAMATGGASAANDHFFPNTIHNSLWVEIRYFKGSAHLRTFRADGKMSPTEIGTMRVDQDFEYDMYAEACARHNSIDVVTRMSSSPSGWYELLRFGRNLGSDLLPNAAAHWREVPTENGTIWVDLNAPGTFKFSDADFPLFMGWQCFEDDRSHDNQRCDSQCMKRLLRDPKLPESIREREVLARRLGRSDTRERLQRAVCKFPSEWNRESIAERYGWLKIDEEFKIEVGKEWNQFEAHAESISFEGLPIDYKSAIWHLHPRAFIAHLRKCQWRSRLEIVQCIPRNSPAGQISFRTAEVRVSTWSKSINLMARKFGIDDPCRMTHLLAHIWAETGYLRLTREAGADHARYAPYIGRGLIQITRQDKYSSYNDFAKITQGGSSFDLELIASDFYHAGNSSGFYWVSKNYFDSKGLKKMNLSRIADEGFSANSIGKLCLWINGGGNHYDHRHVHVFFVKRILDDVAYSLSEKIEEVEFFKMEFDKEFSRVGGSGRNKIVGTKVSNSSMVIKIDHMLQQ